MIEVPRFNVFYGDPPWRQNERKNEGTRFGRGCPYPMMKTADIAALPIKLLRADNAACFLWVTCPKVFEAKEVLRGWGFRYSTVAFVWEKLNPDGTTWAGPGNFSRSNCELLLLGMHGSLPVVDKTLRQVHSIVHPREYAVNKHGKRYSRIIHSRKPELFRWLCAQMFGHNLAKVELFARERSPGWSAIGNELDGSPELVPGMPDCLSRILPSPPPGLFKEQA